MFDTVITYHPKTTRHTPRMRPKLIFLSSFISSVAIAEERKGHNTHFVTNSKFKSHKYYMYIHSYMLFKEYYVDMK